MSKRWLVVVCVAMVALSVMPMASAAPGGTDRPFKASFAGPVHWEFPGEFASGCTEITTVTESPGKATHMGKVMLSSSHCPGEPGMTNDGFGTIVAANGDELYMVYDYDPTSDSNEIEVTFKGGTGRFLGATGQAQWTYYVIPELVKGCNDPESFDCLDFTVSWQWWSTLTGSISY